MLGPRAEVSGLKDTDVLQQLAGLRIGRHRPLEDGRVQDVAIEWHGETAFIGVHVDTLWDGQEPPDEVTVAMRERLLTMPHVGAVRIIPRSPERARLAQDIASKNRRARQEQPRLPDTTQVLAIQSGKGGVGKSTVSVNLAVALTRLGMRSALLDCDIYGFSVPALMGIDTVPRIEDGRMVPPRAHGVEVMSMEFFVKENQAVMWRGPMLGKALRQMTGETAWSDPALMVLDLPPGTGDVALDVHAFFPTARVVVVTTPDPAAARVAVRASNMAQAVGHTLLGVVENLSYAACATCGHRTPYWGSGGGQLVAGTLGAPLLAEIPWDEALVGMNVAIANPTGEAGRAYTALATRILESLPRERDPSQDARPPEEQASLQM